MTLGKTALAVLGTVQVARVPCAATVSAKLARTTERTARIVPVTAQVRAVHKRACSHGAQTSILLCAFCAGSPDGLFCCGTGLEGGINPVPCSDTRCVVANFHCLAVDCKAARSRRTCTLTVCLQWSVLAAVTACAKVARLAAAPVLWIAPLDPVLWMGTVTTATRATGSNHASAVSVSLRPWFLQVGHIIGSFRVRC